MKAKVSRRSALSRMAQTTALALAATRWPRSLGAADAPPALKLKGNLRHSVCRWCYDKIPLEELCRAARAIGLESVELLPVSDFPVLQRFGLTCAVVSGVPGGIENGLNRIENHDRIVAYMEETIPAAARFGAPNVICFSGNRRGLDDEKGLEHCALGLKRIMPIAEKHKVTVVMELLNSKRTHKDYQCDHTAWGVELCKRVGSERFKLLYDIFHMQIMEGDVCDTIRENAAYIAHYHTGGVPGRHEIDETQELHYPRIMQEIVRTGFKGFVAQEFIPKNPDPLGSLRRAVALCDV
jgi:hydroxypyruvate isomerase